MSSPSRKSTTRLRRALASRMLNCVPIAADSWAKDRIVWCGYRAPIRLVHPYEALGQRLGEDLGRVGRRDRLRSSAVEHSYESALQVWMKVKIGFVEDEDRRSLEALDVEEELEPHLHPVACPEQFLLRPASGLAVEAVDVLSLGPK
jgi:hypothetical protein